MAWRCNRDRAEWRRQRKKDPEYVQVRLSLRASQRRARRHLPALIAATGGSCALCGRFLPRRISPAIHVDHIVPRSQGGTDDLDNLQAVHAACNVRKRGALRAVTWRVANEW